MKRRVHLVLLCGFLLSATAQAQDVEPKYKSADTNNAVIRGLAIGRFDHGILVSGAPSDFDVDVKGESEITGNFI